MASVSDRLWISGKSLGEDRDNVAFFLYLERSGEADNTCLCEIGVRELSSPTHLTLFVDWNGREANTTTSSTDLPL